MRNGLDNSTYWYAGGCAIGEGIGFGGNYGDCAGCAGCGWRG